MRARTRTLSLSLLLSHTKWCGEATVYYELRQFNNDICNVLRLAYNESKNLKGVHERVVTAAYRITSLSLSHTELRTCDKISNCF